MTPQSVEALMAEIEAEDCPDYAELSIGEAEARHLMAAHFCEIDDKLARHGLTPEARLEVMAAIAAHTMVENMVLHVHRLRGAAGRTEFQAWLRRHGLS